MDDEQPDPARPYVTVTEDPHFAAVVLFPNGVAVMVCDASDDGEVFENVVVSVFQTPTERVLVRPVTVAPDEVVHSLTH